MISDPAIAKQVSDVLVECYLKIDDTAQVVLDGCPENESEPYRRGVGRVLGWMHAEILAPLYQRHPEIKPEGYP